MTKEISEVQVEVSKNKDADVSPARVKDALDSSGLPRLDSEPLDWKEVWEGRERPALQSCRAVWEKGPRNRRLDRPTNGSEWETEFK